MILKGILVLSAVALALASFAMSFAFVTSFDDATLRNVFVAVAGASCALKLAIPGHFAYTSRPWRSNKPLVVTWLLALILDASFVGAFVSTIRDGYSRDLQAAYDARRAMELDANAKARALRTAKAPARSIEIVRVDFDAAKRGAFKCDLPANQELQRCTAVHVYQRELADHEAFKRLHDEADAAASKLASTKEVIVYPEAARLGKFTRTLPFLSGIEDSHVSAVLWLVMMALFELGAMTCFKAAFARVAAEPVAPAAVPSAPAPVIARHDALFKELAESAAGAGRLSALRQIDGRLRVSQKSTAPLVGLKPRAFATALSDLAALGRIDVVSGSRGTFIRVIS